MIQEFISKEILPHVFRVFAPESCKQSLFFFWMPIDCEMKPIIFKTEQSFIKTL